MIIRLYFPVAFTLIFLINWSDADRRNPLKDPAICGRPECDINNNKFNYSSTIRYKYDYKMHIKTEFSGSGENTSDVYVTASVVLAFPTKCQGILSIQDLELREVALPEPHIDENDYDFDYTEPSTVGLHPNNEQFSGDISRNNLRFSFHDGVISEMCPSDEDSSWVLNFKRGILSAIQNSMARFDVDFNSTETDISGTCDVAYTLNGAVGTSLLIHKRKDISSCVNRYKTNSILQTESYEFRKKFSVWPILRSNSVCNMSIDHHVYNDVSCFERHQLVPFSNNQTGALTESSLQLKLVDEESFEEYNSEEIVITTRTPLTFNHTPTQKPTHGEITASRDLLIQMCKLGFPNIQREFIDVFSKFLQTARLLTDKVLQQLINRAGSICLNGKNHVLESLPYIGSTASVNVMKDEIISGTVPANIVQHWLTSLTYLPRPNNEMLQSFYALLKFGKLAKHPSFTLTSTAVAHTFCRNTPNCGNYKEIKDIVHFLEENIEEELKKDLKNREVHERIIVLLKGLGNVGVVSHQMIYKLQQIIEDDNLPVDIKLEAIYTHRRLDCLKTREFFLDIFRNFNANSELRIAAYLQAIRCPDYMSIKIIKYVLHHEEVNQVGSFVWSHLTNLAKSASPVHVEAQGLLLDGDLGTKFKLDMRKFSRNFENSLFFDEYNFGANAASNVIFGTDSYMPRGTSFNFTADLFGESVNFFEISTRMEGFEHMVETIFGPKGPLNTEKFMEKFNGFTKYFRNNEDSDETLEYLEKLQNRLKRKTPDELEEDSEPYDFESELSASSAKSSIGNSTELFNLDQRIVLQKDVDGLNYNLNYNFDKPKAAFGLKMFGNDIQYKTFEGINEIAMTMHNLNPMKQLQTLFSGKEINYTKSGIFLDVSYDVPLMSGFPLSIHAFGASSIDFRASGSLKAPNFLKNRQLDLHGKLKPSVSVDIIASMQSDYFYGSSGIRVQSNLYSSSSVDATVKIRGSKLASLQFNLPQDRNDIFSARSELLVLRHNVEIPQRGILKRYSNATCTWPVIERAIGLKMCADFSLPDVSNSTMLYPSLLLAGPLNLNIYLNKADVSAKTFLFEYRWDDLVNMSQGSIVFQTPDSDIKRIFMANVTKQPNNYNLSMTFQNGAIVHSAVGAYKNTKDEKRFEIHLNLDGKKNLALEMEMKRTGIKYGWIYYPKFILTINDDRVAGLIGTLKAVDKKNILQYDINLNFETKKMKTKLMGNIIQNEVAISTKMKMEYMFLDSEPESVEIEGELANRSQKSRTEYAGALKINSTAYPQFSFASNLSFISLLGHIETKLSVNNALDLMDPDHTLTIRLMFARVHTEEKKLDGSSTEALLHVTRPKSNIAIKFFIRHEEKHRKGIEHNVNMEVQLAPSKRATGVVSILFLRGPLFAIDTMLNITVPTFEPCVISLRLIEKATNVYNIDFKGTLFTGHSITVKGMYQDKSTRNKNSHHLKVVAKSPHFEDTYINLRYWRDEAELSFNLKVDYAKQPYGLLLKYSDLMENKKSVFTEVKFRDKSYHISINLMSDQPKQLNIELHLDKIRDIHLILKSLSTDVKKETLIEIKWDANRDPTEKLAISAEFNNPRHRTYDGNFLITYPERTFMGNFDLYAGGPEYRGIAHVGWSSYESIQIKFNAGSKSTDEKDTWASITIMTPFDGWRMNSIGGGLYHSNNLFLTNGSITWADNQNLGLAIMADYKVKDPTIKLEFKVALNSTIKDVPTASIHLKHSHDSKKIETDLKLKNGSMNEPLQVYSVKSIWQFDTAHDNVEGAIIFITPFNGYRAGAFSMKYAIADKRKLSCAASLDIEKKRYTISAEGYAKKFTDTMFVANITTPIDKFRNMIGRFGINEKEKYLVAEVRSTERALGVEILYAIDSMADFNVKFNLETPLEAFERILFIGKLKPDTIEFKGGWNKIILGYVGVWRMISITDFEYSYKVFTPLENLTETGFVAKFVRKDEFDLELSVKFAKYKLGIVANGKPKLKILRQYDLKQSDALNSKLLDERTLFKAFESDEENEDDDEEDDSDYEAMNVVGHFALDTMIWPTITGKVDVEEIGDAYFAFGTVKTPHGVIEFKDIFYYPDMLNVKNSLHILTPYMTLKEFTSVYIHSVEQRNYYIIGMEMAGLQYNDWLQAGVCVNYTNTTEETELRTHDILLGLMTPFQFLPTIFLKGNVELEENVYRGNISAKAKETQLSFGLSLESDENFMDTSFGLALDTPLVPDYACKVFFKKDLSDVENSLEVGFDLRDNGTFNMLHVETMWHSDYPRYVSAKGKVRTTLIPIVLVETSMLLTKTPNTIASLDFAYTTPNKKQTEFHIRATQKNEQLSVELRTPLQQFSNVSLKGSMTNKNADGVYHLLGNVYQNAEVYQVDGTIVLRSDIPVDIQLKFKPRTRDGLAMFTYELRESEGGYGKTFRIKLSEGQEKYVQIAGGFSMINQLYWNLAMAIVTSDGILSKTAGLNRVDLNATVSPQIDGSIVGNFEFTSPWHHLGISSLKLETDLKLTNTTGDMQASYELALIKGRSICSWSWILMKDMQLTMDNIIFRAGTKPRILKAGLKYVKDQTLNIGTSLNVDSVWSFGTNATIMAKSMNDAGIQLSVLLPPPFGDVHIIDGLYFSKISQTEPMIDMHYEINYGGEESKNFFSSRGQYTNITHMEGNIKFEWGRGDTHFDKIEALTSMLRKGTRREVSIEIVTPAHKDEQTVTASGSYDVKDIYNVFAGRVNYPASRQVANGDVSFSSMSNMKGNVNSTFPFFNMSWLRGDFDFTTSGDRAVRYLKATWHKDFAFFDLQSAYSSANLDRDMKGTIKIEVPLQTRHIANIDYGLKERRLLSTGHCVIDYNSKKVLNGKYTCKSESRAGFEKDEVTILLENDFKPLGIFYVHAVEQKGVDAEQYDMKRAEIYELHKSNKFNITSELHIATSETGQAYKIVAIHPNRTVIVTSVYDFQDSTTKQNGKLQLAQHIWIAYDFVLENRTQLDNESQMFNIKLSYPRRNLSTEGWYAITDDSFDSDIAFKWTHSADNYYSSENDDTSSSETKTIGAKFQWRNENTETSDDYNQTAILSVRHPSFEKDVSFTGTYHKSPIDIFRTKMIIDYCEDPEHVLIMELGAKDLATVVGYRNYSMDIFGEHLISELDLDMRGSIGSRPGLYELYSNARYKRGYLPLQEGSLDGVVDLRTNEIYYKKASPHKQFKIWGRTGGNFPIYTINGSLLNSPDVNSTGCFYVNIDNKYLQLNVNMTPDASQNLRMLGQISDARNAQFDLHRNYDDIRVVDVAYYLRMNHSRLVTSQLRWRPKMKSEIKTRIKKIATEFYDSLSDNLDFWVKTIYTESTDTIADVWNNAKPYTQVFLDDVGGLRIIEEDLKEFKVFLNQSYEANDFYIKTAVNYTLTVLDELAIRNHINSVPKILNEIWQALGDSGQALHKNILRLIETIKISYRKAVEFIGKVFHGDALEYFSQLMEQGVQRYDKFMKDLHLSLIKYVENAWNRLTNAIFTYWQRFLQRIEPTIFKIYQYLETVLWNISKEVFDFLYKRTNEIVASPYFHTVSNFTHDLDRLYTDIVSNDAITNIKKYSELTWEFVKEEYFKIIPFGKELHDVISEVIEEIKTLQHVEAIQFVIQRINETKMKLEWLAKEFQLENRIQQLWTILRMKIARYAQTALETDDKYREAKTKFIFDPDTGIMELEQKLPMSWHAFNETPIYEEIPEFKMIADVQSFFNVNNYTFWNLYYDVKPYMDLYSWLPPFKSSSLLFGSRHFMTFDKRFISLNSKYFIIETSIKPNQCSYLLAQDYVDSNFTLVVEPSLTKHYNDLVASKKLALITDNKLIDINIVGSTIRIGHNPSVTLPIQIGDTIIYRDANSLIVNSDKGFNLNCNLQYDLCWLELSGWYFGKTAGLLGNMNNEPYDDFAMPSKRQSNNFQEFVDSWSLRNCTQNRVDSMIQNVSSEVISICDSYFRSKISNFVNCFAIIDPTPFYDICLDLGMNSFATVINETHSAQIGTCAAAISYIETCAIERTLLRIPPTCLHCQLINGTYIPEGKFVKLTGNDIPRTTDVVFLIEAKSCNENLTNSKSLMTIVSSLDAELLAANITNNRYAVVAFGGPVPFDKPRSIVYNNQIFNDHINIKHYFDHIKTGASNNSDIFEAMTMAFKLIYRPGASKTFILLPCSTCDANSMKLDYSSILQVILEEGINLHILMDNEFTLGKKRVERKLFGIDRDYAYTKDYLQKLIGDKEFKRQVRIPKSILGVCVPLAMESNGTVFSANKLKPGGKHPIKKIATIFGKRVAITAQPSHCQLCECSGHNSGTSYMACTHCHFSNPSSLDYGFNEEEMLQIMQTDNDFSWEMADDDLLDS